MSLLDLIKNRSTIAITIVPTATQGEAQTNAVERDCVAPLVHHRISCALTIEECDELEAHELQLSNSADYL